MDDTKVINDMHHFVQAHGSQKEAAKALKISEQYLSDMLKGRRKITEKIAWKFAYRAEWVFHPPSNKVCT